LETVDKKWNSIEGKLRDDVTPEYRRNFPPKENLDNLVKASSLQISSLTDFLMEHELHFCRNPKVVSKVYEDVCQSSFLSRQYFLQMNPVVSDIKRQIIIRSIIFHNFAGRKNIEKSMYKLKKSAAEEIRKKCSTLMKELNSVYPSVSLVDTTTYTLPLLSKLNNGLTEEQARLCENLDSRVKIQPKRRQTNESNVSRLSFQICNDSD